MITTNNSTTITKLDYNGMRHGYDALINSVILASIDDLGYDALVDEPTLWWLDLTNTNISALRQAISEMPLKKNSNGHLHPILKDLFHIRREDPILNKTANNGF